MVGRTVALGATVAVLAGFSGLGLLYSRGRVGSVEDLITARDSTGPGMTTATLIASVMGVWILLAVPEAGAAFGGVAAVAGYAVGEMLPLLAYARLGPRIRGLIPGGHSLTEYAYARYGAAMYAFVLLVSLFYMFVFLAAELTGIALAMELVAGVPPWQTAVVVGGFVLLYTTYGGLRASIVTDAVQTLLILPLLVVGVAGTVVALGGTAEVHAAVVATDPNLLDPGFLTGLTFGVWIAIAILGAELINQTWWQRIYAAEDPESLQRGFTVAAVANAAIVFLAGMLGVIARGYADLTVDPTAGGYDASVAFFVLLESAFGDPMAFAVLLLALLLVVSTADTLFNAMASLVTVDLPRLLDDPADDTLRWSARGLTVAVAVAALAVSLRAQSVLELFLLADLFGAAVMVPLLAGLYTERLPGSGALVAGLAGLAVGLPFFANPMVRGALVAVAGGLLPAPSYLYSFVGAAAVSTALTGAAVAVPTDGFDLDRLSAEVRSLDGTAQTVQTDGGRSEPGEPDAATDGPGEDRAESGEPNNATDGTAGGRR